MLGLPSILFLFCNEFRFYLSYDINLKSHLCRQKVIIFSLQLCTIHNIVMDVITLMFFLKDFF